MEEKDFITKVLGKHSDSWLNIYNVYINIRAICIFIVGTVFASYDARMVEENEYNGGLSFFISNQYLAWFVWFFITIIMMFACTLISKVIISYLSDVKQIRDKLKSK